jgi:serine/threonine protein kinase
MGNCNFRAEKDKDSVSGKYFIDNESFDPKAIAITKNHFQFQFAIGKGGFGKVWRVEKKKDKEVFAMKEMSKARVMAKKSVQSVMNELKLLSQMKSP